ncbi:MAG: tetratricopeptide repeat protein [Holophagales bacterium]|nr:tetratricopeptide repeat protein [Holophagales bacterium]
MSSIQGDSSRGDSSPSIPESTDIPEAGHVVDLARLAYLGGANGVLIPPGEGVEEVFVRRGQLYVDRDGELARHHAAAIAACADSPLPASLPEVQKAMRDLARRVLGGASGPAEWSREVRGVELAGPLPMVLFLLESSVLEVDEELLIERLGTEASVLQKRDDTPALSELPGLDPEMAQALVQVERPVRVGDLLRRGDRLPMLRGLVRLWAVGLLTVRSSESREPKSLVAPKILQRFLERIAEELEEDPVELPVEEHRSQVASLLEQMGQLDHYQLLGLERQDLQDTAVSSAYHRISRKVHPSQALRLGLAGKEGALEVLFDKVTDAYLTLSDPLRRSEYNNLMGLHHRVEVASDQRREEKRALARQQYLRGASSLAEMDYSTAVDLLKEAARLDPRHEYLATLGKAQAKNPRWRHHALESFRRAVELEPGNAGYHLALGKVLEGEERVEEAKACFAQALELMPDNVEAQVALDKLTSGGGEPRQSGLRGVLRRRRG